MNRHISLTILFILVSMSFSLQAQVGTLDEVIQTAKQGSEEPAYLDEFIVQYSEKAAAWAKTKNLNSPVKRLALFMTISSIYGGAQRDVWSKAMDLFAEARRKAGVNFVDDNEAILNVMLQVAAGESARALRGAIGEFIEKAPEKNKANSNLYELECGAESVLHLARKNIDTVAVEVRSTLVASRAFSEKVGAEVAARIAYRVIEWVKLNHMLNNLDKVLDATYSRALLVDSTLLFNPFQVEEQLQKFMMMHFTNLKPKALSLLMPWLKLLDPNASLRTPQPPWSQTRSPYWNYAFLAGTAAIGIILFCTQETGSAMHC